MKIFKKIINVNELFFETSLKFNTDLLSGNNHIEMLLNQVVPNLFHIISTFRHKH